MGFGSKGISGARGLAGMAALNESSRSVLSGISRSRYIRPFVEALVALSTDPTPVCAGDFSANGVVGPSDIPGMVGVLLAP